MGRRIPGEGLGAFMERRSSEIEFSQTLARATDRELIGMLSELRNDPQYLGWVQDELKRRGPGVFVPK